METITIYIDGQPRSAELGRKLYQYLPAEHPCGGHGICGKCKVTVTGVLPEPDTNERRLLQPEELEAGVRLACSMRIAGPCWVTTRWNHSEHQSRIVTHGEMPRIDLDPAFSGYGAAIDIGTTTLAAKLFDGRGQLLGQTSCANPQAFWGADVISRIEAAIKGNAERLQSAVCQALTEMLCALAHQAGIQTEEIDGLVITGNTVMLSLLTGTAMESLSRAPFTMNRAFGECLRAGELGLHVLRNDAQVYLPACIGAFVGADTVCALLASRLCETAETKLLVDVGTNGELCLWHKGVLYAASTAAGPAFEGVGIQMGMQAEPGAIDRVQRKNGELQVHAVGDVSPRGICGSGLIDAVAELLESEQIDETGFLENAPIRLAGTVFLTQQDIRMVQLAKSAICAGIHTLMKAAGISEENVQETVIAGGFGHYLDIGNAVRIGLFPKALEAGIRSAGNAALAGAAMLLLNRKLRQSCQLLAAKAQVITLSENPVFTQAYTMGMWFPEKDREGSL